MAHSKACRNGGMAYIEKDSMGMQQLRCCNADLVDGMCIDLKPLPKDLGFPMKRSKAIEEEDANIVASSSLPITPKGGFKI